jgi:hypothetical protein
MDGRVLILSSIGGEHALDPRRYSLDFEAAGIDDRLHTMGGFIRLRQDTLQLAAERNGEATAT